MTFDEFEVRIRTEIDNFLDGTNTDARYDKFTSFQTLKLQWILNPNTADEALMIFKITMEYECDIVTFSLGCNYTFGEDEDNLYNSVTVEIPYSEEEYFQMSTLEDMGFSWEFYQYLDNIFKQLSIGKII